jgi:hypothetical protein
MIKNGLIVKLNPVFHPSGSGKAVPASNRSPQKAEAPPVI